MLDPLLSLRGGTTVASLNRPWRFAPRATYHPDTNPTGLISFGTAENALVTSDLVKFTEDNVDIKAADFLYNGSTGGGPELPGLIATHLNEYLSPHSPIAGEQVRVVGAATAMHDILAWAVANPRDGFLTTRPVYGRFELDFFNKSGVKVVYADSDFDNCFDEDVVDKLEAALQDSNSRGVKIKAVFIVNPHNPLGKCYPRKTLIRILDFCQKHRLHLLCDEIYACSVFDSGEPDAVPFTSILSIDVDQHIDPRRLHVTYGLSKDFGAAGLRVGAIVTRSQSVLQAVDAVMRFHNPSGPSLAVGRAMLGDRQWCRAFIDGSRAKLAEAYKHVTAGLQDIGVEYLGGSNAGFFVWINLSPYLPEEPGQDVYPEFALARRLQDGGVFLHPREEHSLTPGWFRLVYTQDPQTVTEGLNRIKAVISRQ